MRMNRTAPLGASVLGLLVGCTGGGSSGGASVAPAASTPRTAAVFSGVVAKPTSSSVMTKPATAAVATAAVAALRVTSSPANPAVNAPFTVEVSLVDASGQLLVARTDTPLTLVASKDSGLEPGTKIKRVLRKGSSVTSFSELRAANSGRLQLAVEAGKVSHPLTVLVGEVAFGAKASAEKRLDLGGTGYSGADMAARDEQAAVVWTDARLGRRNVFVATTKDGGKTWRYPVRADHGTLACRAPSVAVDGAGLVAVAWADADGVHANVSTDGGSTWAPRDSRLDAPTVGALGKTCKNVRVATSLGRVFVTWSDDRSALIGDQVFVARSLDGRTWEPERRIDSSLAAITEWRVASVSMAASGDTVSVLYVENGRLFAVSSQDGGLTFARAQRLDTGTPRRLEAARLIASGGILHAAWFDDQKTANDPRAKTRRSLDGGVTWGKEYFLPVAGQDLHFPMTISLTASGSNVVVVFTALTSPLATSDRVFVARSTDGGETYNLVKGAVPKLTADGARNARAASCGKHVVVTWNESYGNGQRANSSSDGGASFAPLDEQIDGSKAVTGVYTSDRLVANGGASAHLVWGELRGPNAKAHLYAVTLR